MRAMTPNKRPEDPPGGPRVDDILVEVLKLANEPLSFEDAASRLTAMLQTWSGCEAVGLRLRRGPDFPYYENRGFQAEFVQAENSLCARTSEGRLRRSPQGEPILECLCGSVIRGRTDPAQPFFTEGGSFWTNGTSGFTRGVDPSVLPSNMRYRCNRDGYESVALIPLPAPRGGQLGLLQFNDTRPGKFDPSMIETMERLAAVVANLALRHRQRTELERLHKRNEVLLREVNHRVKNNLVALGGMLKLGATQARSHGLVRCATVIDKVRSRTIALGVVHQLLSGGRWSEVQLADLVREIANETVAYAGGHFGKAAIEVVGTSTALSADQAHHVGIIVHELVANALEHRRECASLAVVFTLECSDEGIVLVCSDTGPGFSDESLEHAPKEGGLHLVRELAAHSLAGVVTFSNGDLGAVVKLEFPRRG